MATGIPVTITSPREEKEKPQYTLIPLRHSVIHVTMTVRHAPAWAWTLPVEGGHTEPSAMNHGKKIMDTIRGVSFGTEIFKTHRLVSVRRRDVSYNGKRRDKFIFTLVPAEDWTGAEGDAAFMASAFAALSLFFAKEAFNTATVYDNGDRGLVVDMRGQTGHQQAYRSFVTK